jgi:hypothetical protein
VLSDSESYLFALFCRGINRLDDAHHLELIIGLLVRRFTAKHRDEMRELGSVRLEKRTSRRAAPLEKRSSGVH